MVFPLDDNFVFGDNFFFLGDNIFLAPLVDILQLFAKWAEVEKKWGFFSWLIIFFSPKATKKITQPRKKPPLFSTSAHFAKTLQNTQPKGATKILLTHDKKNYSPRNEVTHPTETLLCLWYDVFMPPPFFCYKFWK